MVGIIIMPSTGYEASQLYLYRVVFVAPAIAVILFWIYKPATPRKMLAKLVIVDADTGEKPSVTQFILRYISYFASIPLLFLGVLWIDIDKRKQGWHDKIANTVVIEKKRSSVFDFSLEEKQPPHTQ